MRVTLVPHTHWDREWYEPFESFLLRLVGMMDTLIELGDRGFPHFHLDGQTAMIDDYLAVRPEREGDVRRLVEAGVLSAGPWVTQMDEFLTSGETHVRNLEMGRARARSLGLATEIGYLPDQFGHIGQMPQILRNHGIDRAVVWRGVPAAVDRSAFRWEAPDGSSVVAEYLALGYSLGADLHRLEDPQHLADALRRALDHLTPFVVDDRVLITVGSDHAGPDGELPGRLRAAEPLLSGTSVRIGSLRDHLDGAATDDLPVWRGELRSSARAHLLPNVYSARVHQKRERGRVEALVERYAEPLAALVPGFEWPQARLDRAWTLLLWNGAHDSVCGCSHDQVARDVDARYREARAIAEDVADEALESLGDLVGEAGVLRFNPSPFERDGVPGLGWRVDDEADTMASTPVELSVDGDRIVVDGTVALTLLDEPDVGDLYNFCPAQEEQEPEPPASVGLDGNEATMRWGGLEARVRILRRVGESFYRLDGSIDNARPDHRLRLALRLSRPGVGSVAGSPFEIVERPLHSEGGALEAPSPTWPARHLVLAGGVAAYHEGVFEYEVTDDELLVTLLRCVGTISREHLATRPWPAGPGVPTPDAQMLGRTELALGLRSDARIDVLLEDWERFALLLRRKVATGRGDLPATGSLLPIAGDAALSGVRRAADAVQVTAWNPHRARPATLVLDGRRTRLGPAQIRSISVEPLGSTGT